MGYNTAALAGPLTTSSVTQTAQSCDSMIDRWIEVVGASVGTFDVELSTDGATWAAPASLAGLDGSEVWYEVPQPATDIRIKPTGLTVTRIRLRARRD